MLRQSSPGNTPFREFRHFVVANADFKQAGAKKSPTIIEAYRDCQTRTDLKMPVYLRITLEKS